jgi:hypothetical protein
MKRMLFAIALVIGPPQIHAAGFDHTAWDGLLQRHVVTVGRGHATQVDYSGIATERIRLEEYLATAAAVTRTSFDRWAEAEQLAFLINVYNAWTIELILTGDPEIGSIKDLGSWWQSPWKRSFIDLFGARVSLDDIEHGLIRDADRYREPRIHFAVNCASIGCPALRPEAYTGERLTAQLGDATEIFLGDRSRNRLDGDVLRVSPIFKWYRADFERGWGGYTSLAQFLATHALALGLSDTDVVRLQSGAIAIEFLDYDWRLNRIP